MWVLWLPLLTSSSEDIVPCDRTYSGGKAHLPVAELLAVSESYLLCGATENVHCSSHERCCRLMANILAPDGV